MGNYKNLFCKACIIFMIMGLITFVNYPVAFSQCSKSGSTDIDITYDWYLQTNSNIIDKDIIVKDDGNLILDNRTFYVRPGVQITIEPGGRMEVTGSIIKMDPSCTNSFWCGIKVLGSGNDFSQITNGSYDINYADFGYLKITNAIIYNISECGNGSHGINSIDGGIIIAENSEFYDNLPYTFYFANYTPKPPLNWSDPQPPYNLCKISECKFNWSTHELYNSNSFGTFIYLTSCNYIRIEGNQFSNWNSEVEFYRGNGIYSYNSTIFVHRSKFSHFDENGCPVYDANPQKNIFRHLSKGIEWYSSGYINSLGVDNSEFYYCLCGIETNGGVKNLISSNTFVFKNDSSKWGTSGYPFDFLLTANGKLNQIYNNTFTSDNLEQVFIRTSNGGPDDGNHNSIYKNYLKNTNTEEGNETIGNYISNNCDFLDIKCNDYDGINRDWFVEANATLGTQLSRMSVNSVMANHFSVDGTSYYNITDLSTSGLKSAYFYIWDNDERYRPNDDYSIMQAVNLNPSQTREDYCVNLPCSDPFPPSGIEKDKFENDNLFEIFPNPGNDLISIDVKSKSLPTVKLKIFNSYGEIIYENSLTCGVNQINLESYPSGIYLFILDFDKVKMHKKVMIIK